MSEVVKTDNVGDTKILYRLLRLDSALKTIESGNLRVGRVHEFNDPFEWIIGVKGLTPENTAEANRMLSNAESQLKKNVGVVCFCEDASTPTLWSHYADNHKGIALEVDYLKDENLNEITYSDSRPCIEADWLFEGDLGMQKILPQIDRMLKEKALCWKYETEYRVKIDLNRCETKDGSYFDKFPDNFLQRVILGYQCPIEEEYVIRTLKKSGFEDVEVCRAQMSMEEYKILF